MGGVVHSSHQRTDFTNYKPLIRIGTHGNILLVFNFTSIVQFYFTECPKKPAVVFTYFLKYAITSTAVWNILKSCPLPSGVALQKKPPIADNMSRCLCYSVLCKAPLCAVVHVLSMFSCRLTAGSSSLGEVWCRKQHSEPSPHHFLFQNHFNTAVTPSAVTTLHEWAALFTVNKYILVCFYKAGSRLISTWSTALETSRQYQRQKTSLIAFPAISTFRSNSICIDIVTWLSSCKFAGTVILQKE